MTIKPMSLRWLMTCVVVATASHAVAQSPAAIRDQSNAGAAITGHVTDSSSSPISNYSVVVFPTDRTKWSVASRFLRLVRPTQDGSFDVSDLPPGEYWVAATDPIESNEVSGDWLKPETLERLSFRAQRVTLMERQRVLTVLRLIHVQ